MALVYDALPLIFPKPAIIRPATDDLLRYGKDPVVAALLAHRLRRVVGAPTVAFLQHAESIATTSTFTFSAQNVGTAAGNRKIIAAISYDILATTSLTSITAAASSMTIVAEYENTNVGNIRSHIALAIIDLPTGTTADFVVTLGSNALGCHLSLYRVVDLLSSTPTDTATAGSVEDPSTTIDVPAGGFAVAIATDPETGSTTWVGLATEDYDATDANTWTYSGAHESFASAQTGMTVTANFSFADNRGALAVAAWGN